MCVCVEFLSLCGCISPDGISLILWPVIVDIYFSLPQIMKKLNAIFCIACLPKKGCIFGISSALNGHDYTDPAQKGIASCSACSSSLAENYIVCVCAYVCPPLLHLKETPKEKLNNTLPLTKFIKQLCPHVFLDLKVLYLNSFQIMSKKKNDVTVYVGSHKGLYLFHTIQIVSREFFLLISWRVSLTTGLCSLSLTAWKVKVFSTPSPKKVKWSVKQSQINK